MRAAEDHCQAAYITSLLGSQDLKQMILGRSAEKFLFLSQQICYRDSLQKLNRKKQQQN